MHLARILLLQFGEDRRMSHRNEEEPARRSRFRLDSEYVGAAKSSVMCVTGNIDWTTSSELRSEIDECLVLDHPAHLIVDLNQVIRVDSSGVGALVSSLREADKQHVQFTLCGVNPSLRRLLHRTCLDDVFEIRQNVSDALRAARVH